MSASILLHQLEDDDALDAQDLLSSNETEHRYFLSTKDLKVKINFVCSHFIPIFFLAYNI